MCTLAESSRRAKQGIVYSLTRSLYRSVFPSTPTLKYSSLASFSFFCCNKQKVGYSGPHLTKGMCTKCLANSSYVVLPLPRLLLPVRLEAVILVSADHLQLDSRDSGADHRVRAMAFSIYPKK
jgi:hypothetical protein